jgi:hypothetical protein
MTIALKAIATPCPHAAWPSHPLGQPLIVTAGRGGVSNGGVRSSKFGEVTPSGFLPLAKNWRDITARASEVTGMTRKPSTAQKLIGDFDPRLAELCYSPIFSETRTKSCPDSASQIGARR